MIARQLLDALAYMHLNNVTHRDLKLENLLLARPNDISSVVIADFGLARNAKTARQVFQTQCGTPSYVAPEILLGKPYTCLLYTSPSPRDGLLSRMPSSA